MVALSIVAVALLAGMRATSALINNAQRQIDVMLAHICAENELVKVRLSRQLPGLGNTLVECAQAERNLQVTLLVRATPNPDFQRVDVQVGDGGVPILQLATVVTRY